MQGGFNYVWNSPARSFFNPIEMSYQAPFVDAATSVDPVNRNNTFISYYSYGSVLGLALDLELRNTSTDLNLDDYMKLVWQKYGKAEKPYTIENLQMVLNEYAGDGFGDKFFNAFIYDSQMPDYENLFKFVGLSLEQSKEEVRLGASLRDGSISANPTINSPAYLAGLNQGDKIIAIDEHVLSNRNTLKYILDLYNVSDKVEITFARNNKLRTTELIFDGDPSYKISIAKDDAINTEDAIKARKQWLGAK